MTQLYFVTEYGLLLNLNTLTTKKIYIIIRVIDVTCLFGEGGLNFIRLDYARLCAGEDGPLGRKVIER